MATAWDVAFGRLAIQRGLVSQEAVRAAFQQLPPGRSLGEELVRRGLLAPERAAQLAAWLRANASPSGRLPQQPGPPPDDGLTLRPAPSEDATVTAPPGGAASTTAGHDERGTGLPQEGDVVGGYVLEQRLGAGGVGAVFRARDPRTGGEVALKVLLPTGDVDGAALARFQREAEAAAKVDAHPGIVRVRTVGSHQGLPFVVMDLVEGRDLRRIVKAEGALDPERALRYTEQVARAVEHCHQRGVLHRDLKPANVLLREEDDAPLVMDFGLALDRDRERLTRTGEVMGTPAYMPPEQADGDKAAIDARADVYALGAILFELVTGRPPFEGQQLQILRKVFLEMPPPIASLAPHAPADVDVIVRKAMAKDRALRYESAGALADDVARLRRGEPIRARAPTRWQELRWRWRKRDPRLFARVAAGVVLALAPLVAWAARGYARAKTIEGLADAVADVGLALEEDPWPLAPGASTRLALHAEAIRALQVDLGWQAPASSQAHGALAAAALELARRLERGDEATDDLVRALRGRAARPTSPEEARLTLVRLARRLGVDGHDLAPGCSPGHADEACWDPSLAPALDAEHPEDRLVAALRALGWSRPGHAAAPDEAAAARAVVQELAGRPGAAGAVALDVERRLADVEARIDALLAEGRDALIEAVKRAVAAGGELERPAAWASLEQVQLPAARDHVERHLRAARPAAAADTLERMAAALAEAEGRWNEGETYSTLRRAVELVLDLAEVGGDPPPDVIEQLGPGVSSIVYAAGSRAQAAKLAANASASFTEFVVQHLHYLANVEDDAASDTADFFALGTLAGRERGRALTGDLAVAALRLGLPLRADAVQAGELPRIMGELDALEVTTRLGEVHLARALLWLGTRARDNRRDLAKVEPLLHAFAAALGDELDPAFRERHELPPAPRLRAPLTRSWRAYARGGLGLYGLRRERLRAQAAGERPRRELVDAWIAWLDALDRATFHGNEHSNLLRDVAQEVRDLRKQLQKARHDDPWVQALRAEEPRRFGAAVLAAERDLLRAADERRRADGQTGARFRAFRDALDVDREARKSYSAVVSDLADVLVGQERLDDAARLLTEADGVLSRVGVAVLPELLLQRARLELERGDPAAAKTAAEVAERVERMLPALDDKDSRHAEQMRSRARSIEARAREALGGSTSREP